MLTVRNPANDEVLAELPTADKPKIEQAWQQAQAAQQIWAQTSYLQRSKIITEFKRLLETEGQEAAELLSSEMGKPVHQAAGEIRGTCARIHWFLEHTPKELTPEAIHVASPMTENISYEPLGVIANISAWNFPYFVGTNVFIPALLTGNAVLYKPSEFASLTGLRIGTLLKKSGLPDGVFQVLIGGQSTGEALSALPLNGMFFTGSQQTGNHIAQKVASRFVRLGLELGGKDPAYICDDADVKTAAETVADGAFYNAGQSCCAVERIYVHKNIYQEFMQHFLAFAATLKIGDPKDPKTYMGPLARKAQLEILEDQIQDALAKGAELALKGGRRTGPGNFFDPTILTHVNHKMKVMQEESFGPIIGIQIVSDDEEALALMNDSVFGLTSSVHSNNQERAVKIMQRLNCGTVYWNCCDRVSPYLPWTGRKGSGLGSTLSHLGIKAFLQPKAWHLKDLSV